MNEAAHETPMALAYDAPSHSSWTESVSSNEAQHGTLKAGPKAETGTDL